MNQDPQEPVNSQPEQPASGAAPTTPVVEQPQSPKYAQPVALAPVTFPGKALGIASFVVSLIGGGLIALVLGIIALRQSKAAGRKNGFAVAGIVIGAVSIVVSIAFVLALAAAGTAISNNTVCTDVTAADGTVSKHCTLK